MEFYKSLHLEALDSYFSTITIAAPSERPSSLSSNIQWYQYAVDETRSESWNYILRGSTEQWVLFLEDDEKIEMDSFPQLEDLSSSRWVPAQIQYHGPDKMRAYYQIRLVQQTESTLFEGKNMTDCTHFITQNQIQLIGDPLVIYRETDPIAHVEPAEEMSVQAPSPQLYLVEGEQLFRQGKYVYAAAIYRKLLRMETLLPFDRLGAVNGLASCLTEQFKWQDALLLAQKSLQAESDQKIPYLIQFRIYQLQQQWDRALTILSSYYRSIHQLSKANFDQSVDERQTLLWMKEVAFKAGWKKQAYEYLEKLYDITELEREPSLIHQLLVLAIELLDYDKAVYFFRQLYWKNVTAEPVDSQKQEIGEIMDLFIKNGWHEYVLEVYSLLYQKNPLDQDYKRRLIFALAKNNRMDKARRLIAKHS